MKSIANLLIVALAVCVIAPALALEDTPANRAEQTDNYLRAVSPKSLMDDLVAKTATTVPEAQRGAFIVMMTKNLDIKELTGLMRAAMIKNFTADELKALADFYGSSFGQSATAKMGNYMADVTPGLLAEIEKAHALTQQQMKAQ